MKKITFALVFMFLSSSAVFAEDIKEEALDSLSTAQNLVKKGNYNKAVEEINYALSKINELTAEGLVQFIPDAPEGYTLEKKSSQGIGQGASMVGNAGANATYIGNDNSSIQLNIAIGGLGGKMGSLAAFGSMFAGLSQEAGGVKTTRINGYTGTLQFDAMNKNGNLSLQIGPKTSVQIQGDNISSPDILKDLAKKIDLAGLEENY